MLRLFWQLDLSPYKTDLAFVLELLNYDSKSPPPEYDDRCDRKRLVKTHFPVRFFAVRQVEFCCICLDTAVLLPYNSKADGISRF